MRLVLHGDLVAAARYLLPLPHRVRRDACRRLIEQAHAAHGFARRTGRCHPIWGDGSLISAATRTRLAAEPSLRDSDYCTCLEMVLHEIVTWREERRVPSLS